MKRMRRSLWCGFLGVLPVSGVWSQAQAEAWPTYRHDRARSGITTDSLSPPLALQWVFKPAHAPKPAWMAPAEELPRAHFDNAYHVSAANGLVYFGSSADDKVYALSATTGEVRWTFFAEGPVRFAPTVWKDRVYVGSDDGYVYCLDSAAGTLVWKYRAGPSGEKVIGNGRMISLWPVRTSVLVDEGVVYFGAGVFPYEGLYICALKADDGVVIWKNDTVGDRAHEQMFGGVSPQSYLVASKEILYVPSGRAMPVAFDRKNGTFLYVCAAGGKVGGSWAMVEGSELIAGVERSGEPAKVAFDEKTGRQEGDAYAWFPGLDMVVTPEISYALNEEGIYAIDRAKYPALAKQGDALVAERKELEGKLSTLKGRLGQPDTKGGEDVKRQIEELAGKVREIEKEQGRLKESAYKWKYPGKDLCCVVLAADVLYAGGKETVVAMRAGTGESLWSGKVNGTAFGLAVADGRLLVSTEKGPVYCFSKEPVAQAKEVIGTPRALSSSSGQPADLYEAAAEAIVGRTGAAKGFCLVLDCGEGRLASALARRTEMKIIGIEADPKKVEIARRHLDVAGLYGSRVVVESWPMSALPDYFANLIVSDGMVASGKMPDGAAEVFRVLRPCGGVVCLGQPAGAPADKSPDAEKLLGWMKGLGGPEPKVARENGVWATLARGKLQGAGSWTQLYGNPQNTACSDDELARFPLGTLWFGEPGPERMVERHARAPSPVSINGRLFVEGEEVVMAYDAYNGAFLWEREIPGAVRVRVDVDGGNVAASEDGVYVVARDKCHRLDPATGQTVRVYDLPASPDGGPRRWGYIACVGNLLLGSATAPLKSEYGDVWRNLVKDGGWKGVADVRESYRAAWKSFQDKYPTPTPAARAALHRAGALWRGLADYPAWGSERTPKDARTPNMMTSDAIFVMEADTGKLRWIHRGERIAHITVTVGEGKLYFAEGRATDEQRAAALKAKQELIKQKKYEEGPEALLAAPEADVRLVTVLDVETGSKLWEKSLDVTGCGGDKMGTAYRDGVLLLFGHFSNHDTRFFLQNTLTWRRITALDAKTGDVLWSRPLNYLRRPVVMGDSIIIEPRACDLRTGAIKTRVHPVSGQTVPWEFLRPGHCCSITSAAPNALFYRSYNAAMYDLAGDGGITLFGGIRPGCWLNLVAANGLVLMPEASSGCTCSFPIKCSVAFANKRADRPRPWSVFVSSGPTTPAKHLAINLGAPGDMRDDQGRVWFGYPRPKAVSSIGYGSYGVKFKLEEKILEGAEGAGYFCRDFRNARVPGTEKPWLFTSGCVGLVQCDVPLTEEDAKEAARPYTVRLGFAAPTGDREAQRVFDIKLQGKTVLENFDIVRAAGAANTAVVKEFKGIQVKGSLRLELVPKVPNANAAQAPVINAIEAVLEDTREAFLSVR